MLRRESVFQRFSELKSVIVNPMNRSQLHLNDLFLFIKEIIEITRDVTEILVEAVRRVARLKQTTRKFCRVDDPSG